jgi:hypothetical protein
VLSSTGFTAPNSSSSSSNTNLIIIVVVAVVAGIALIIFLIFLALLRRQRRGSKDISARGPSVALAPVSTVGRARPVPRAGPRDDRRRFADDLEEDIALDQQRFAASSSLKSDWFVLRALLMN